MQLFRTKFPDCFILRTKKWIKCFLGENPVNSRGKAGDITAPISIFQAWSWPVQYDLTVSSCIGVIAPQLAYPSDSGEMVKKTITGVVCCAAQSKTYDTCEQSETIITHFTKKTKLKLTLRTKCKSTTSFHLKTQGIQI